MTCFIDTVQSVIAAPIQVQEKRGNLERMLAYGEFTPRKTVIGRGVAGDVLSNPDDKFFYTVTNGCIRTQQWPIYVR